MRDKREQGAGLRRILRAKGARVVPGSKIGFGFVRKIKGALGAPFNDILMMVESPERQKQELLNSPLDETQNVSLILEELQGFIDKHEKEVSYICTYQLRSWIAGLKNRTSRRDVTWEIVREFPKILDEEKVNLDEGRRTIIKIAGHNPY